MADSDPNPSSPTPPPGASPYADRRRNHALRELIDEMLASIRAASHQELWTPDERAQYERELSTIMSRVRTQTLDGQTEASAGPKPER